MARTLVKTIDIDQLNSDISGINEVPDVGLDGQVLTKTATDYEWQDAVGGETEIVSVSPDYTGSQLYFDSTSGVVDWPTGASYTIVADGTSSYRIYLRVSSNNTLSLDQSVRIGYPATITVIAISGFGGSGGAQARVQLGGFSTGNTYYNVSNISIVLPKLPAGTHTFKLQGQIGSSSLEFQSSMTYQFVIERY